MTRGDKFMLVGLLLVSLLSGAALYGRFSLLAGGSESAQAVITVAGKPVREIGLPAQGRSAFVVHGRLGSSTVEVEGGRIRMREAPCPGRVCVNHGWIESPGQSIACVPGEILIRVEGAAPLDAVTR